MTPEIKISDEMVKVYRDGWNEPPIPTPPAERVRAGLAAVLAGCGDGWTVTDGEPLEGALYHWLLTPHDAIADGRGLWSEEREEFWWVIEVLQKRFGLTYWCMGSRSWEGGVVHVLVGDPSSDTIVKFEMGTPPDSEVPNAGD